jgi:hypothetical protein
MVPAPILTSEPSPSIMPLTLVLKLLLPTVSWLAPSEKCPAPSIEPALSLPSPIGPVLKEKATDELSPMLISRALPAVVLSVKRMLPLLEKVALPAVLLAKNRMMPALEIVAVSALVLSKKLVELETPFSINALPALPLMLKLIVPPARFRMWDPPAVLLSLKPTLLLLVLLVIDAAPAELSLLKKMKLLLVIAASPAALLPLKLIKKLFVTAAVAALLLPLKSISPLLVTIAWSAVLLVLNLIEPDELFVIDANPAVLEPLKLIELDELLVIVENLAVLVPLKLMVLPLLFVNVAKFELLALLKLIVPVSLISAMERAPLTPALTAMPEPV